MSTGFTCVACLVQFPSRDEQRVHHQSDWHRYNLKRKMAELAPVTASEFAQRVDQVKSQPEAPAAPVGYHCDACKKNFGSQQTLDSHLNSKKHKQALTETKKEPDASQKQQDNSLLKKNADDARRFRRQLNEATTEEEVMAIIEEKVKSAPTLEPQHDCLFCAYKSNDIDENLEHMTSTHSFFIPDVEFLVDLEGLLRYLGEKVSKKNWCIFCNEKGKSFHSLEAVQKHMQDKGHQKMAYEDEADIEYADYYDFSSTWNEEEWVDVGSDAEMEDVGDGQLIVNDASHGGVRLSADESELILPSGQRAGHRSLVRYYRQRLRPSQEKEAEVIARLAERYGALGYFTAPELVKVTKAHQRQANRNEAHLRMRIGCNANGLQRYFRRTDL